MSHRLLTVESRRHFIKSASGFALTLPAMTVDLSWLQHKPPVEDSVDTQRPTQIDIADRQESGVRILVRGTIYDPDDKPVPNVKIFLYQTDAAGYYSRPFNNPRQARLRGTVWSNAQGQYGFSSIRPAHYVNITPLPPMHIHVHLEPPDLPNHWVDSYYFEGDPRLRQEDIARAREMGRYSNIVQLAPGEPGVLQGVRNFRIDPALAARNQLVNGWYRQSSP
jgi:protocatechuate 3,4-dioxygenase beta subunit